MWGTVIKFMLWPLLQWTGWCIDGSGRQSHTENGCRRNQWKTPSRDGWNAPFFLLFTFSLSGLSLCLFLHFSMSFFLSFVYCSFLLITAIKSFSHCVYFFYLFIYLFFTNHSSSLCHPFWSVFLFLPLWFSLCPPLSHFLFPSLQSPSVNAVMAVSGCVGRDGERERERWGGRGGMICHLLQAG